MAILIAARRRSSNSSDDNSDISALQCQQCSSQLQCHAAQVTVPRSWQAIVRSTVAPDTGVRQLELLPLIPPPGYGCSNVIGGGSADHDDCPWMDSCAANRNDTQPFCGSCDDGFSEAFGTSECISVDECGNGKAIASAMMGVTFAVLYILFKSTRPESISGAIMDAILFYAQSVDLVLPAASSLSQVMAVFDLSFGGTGGTSRGVCLFAMDAVQKLLTGYILPVAMFALWLFVAIIRFIQYVICGRKGRTLSATARALQQPLTDAEPNVDDQAVIKRCCENRLPIPSVELALLYMALLSYSGVTKTTMALLQCRQSPLDDHKLVMYMAGNVECYRQWYDTHTPLCPCVCVG